MLKGRQEMSNKFELLSSTESFIVQVRELRQEKYTQEIINGLALHEQTEHRVISSYQGKKKGKMYSAQS